MFKGTPTESKRKWEKGLGIEHRQMIDSGTHDLKFSFLYWLFLLFAVCLILGFFVCCFILCFFFVSVCLFLSFFKQRVANRTIEPRTCLLASG